MIGIIGRMDARILIQRPASERDSQGSVIQSWMDRGTVWAKAESLTLATALETTNGNDRTAASEYRFTIRHQSLLNDLATTDRIVWNEANFDILSVTPMPEGRPDHIIITARRRA